MEEHDVVILKIEVEKVPKGAIGTIVHKHSSTLYEVEFLVGDSTFVEKVYGNQMKLKR